MRARSIAVLIALAGACGGGAAAPADGAAATADAPTVIDSEPDLAGDPPADAGPAPDLEPAEAACAEYARLFCDEKSRCNRGALLSVWGDVAV